MAGRHTVTWDELVVFARSIDRDITHVYRVVKGDRESPPVAEAFAEHFGFPMAETSLAGRKPIRRLGGAA